MYKMHMKRLHPIEGVCQFETHFSQWVQFSVSEEGVVIGVYSEQELLLAATAWAAGFAGHALHQWQTARSPPIGGGAWLKLATRISTTEVLEAGTVDSILRAQLSSPTTWLRAVTRWQHRR